MDLIAILKSRLDDLPDGPYMQGLRAVHLHVQAAADHHARGQDTGDERAFTDAIYRTNQAFEGALKEAYRVLTGEDPARVSTNDVEQHLSEHRFLRPRVSDQLTIYRRNWRNPSTHDYKLDFDEDEALLAIASVAVFAIVLVDQIAERLSYQRAKAEAIDEAVSVDSARPLVDQVADAIDKFTHQFNTQDSARFNIRESELAGAVSGFLSGVLGGAKIQVEAALSDAPHVVADLLVQADDVRVLVEIKRTKPSSDRIEQGVEQLNQFMAVSGIDQAVLYFYYSHNSGRVSRQERVSPDVPGRLIIIATEPVELPKTHVLRAKVPPTLRGK
jgi:hypothetical protein